MANMIKRLIALLTLIIIYGLPVSAQGNASQLLAQINDLRVSVGLSGYTTNSALTAAANNHAAWMVNTGKVSHTQDDGSGPRSRAQNAGYSSNFVSENIYMGSRSGINDAWTFWINSPIHYAGLTSPNYNNIGIGTAGGANGFAFVLVFGNSTGSLPRIASSASGGNGSGAPEIPSFVVGVDAIGNIMHEVQPGDTVGEIALIYGYTWSEIPYMLGINGMEEPDAQYLEIGSVFLVPPQDGTYTPTPAPLTATPTRTTTPTLPPKTATEARVAIDMVPPATFIMPSQTPTKELIIRAVPTATSTPTPLPAVTSATMPPEDNSLQTLLIVAVIVQVGVIGVATIEFLRRSD